VHARDQGPCRVPGRAADHRDMSTSAITPAAGPGWPELPLPGPADVVLADGRLAVIRSLTPADGPALFALHDEVSDDALRMRFFNVSRPAARSYVEHVLAHPETLALVAEVDGRVVGFATAEPIYRDTVDTVDTFDTVEIALLVSDAHHGQGLGTLLMEHLFALARDRGVRRVEAEVLVENHPMLEVLAHAGFGLTQHPDRGVVTVTLTTTSTPAVQNAADRREFQAQSRSLAPLLAPRSVAVVGVRSDGTGVGAAVVRSIASNGYAGRVVVVHPRHRSVAGVRAYPSFGDVPHPVDLAVIAVPAESTASARTRPRPAYGRRSCSAPVSASWDPRGRSSSVSCRYWRGPGGSGWWVRTVSGCWPTTRRSG